jgi:hypothetical protein
MRTDGKRQRGTILFYVEAPDDQQRARRFDIVQGVLQADNGWIYAWRVGHSYRDGTTPDKLQPGCRVSFEVLADQPWFATGLSSRGVGDTSERPHLNDLDRRETCWCGAHPGELHRIT